MDIFQREIEYDYVCRYLEPTMRILEVGCGNGFSTERFRELVERVDAFDYAESMIERARERIGERNNSFLHDNVLDPQSLDGTVRRRVCVRVLINLADLEQQRLALTNMANATEPGGLLILAEGFTDGFEALERAARESRAARRRSQRRSTSTPREQTSGSQSTSCSSSRTRSTSAPTIT